MTVRFLFLLVIFSAFSTFSIFAWGCREAKPHPMESQPEKSVSIGTNLPSSQMASLAIHNARIFTAEEDAGFATAMAMVGETIVYVGDGDGLEAFLGDRTEIHDLKGQLVLPGFHDVHQHTLEAHLPLINCLLDASETDPEAYISVVSKCEVAGGTGWVLGWGHNIFTLLDGARSPRAILDEAQPDVPVAVMEVSSHSTWVNSRALEILGITASTPNPQGGLIVHDANGEPNGLLIDAAGEFPWDRALVPNDALHAMNIEALREAMAHNNQVGITSATDARTYVERGYLEAYKTLLASNGITVRMVLSLWASPIADDDEQIARLKPLFHDKGGLIRVRQIKFYSDGIVGNTTAALLAPYSTSDTLGSPIGLNYFPKERLIRYITELQAVGFDAHIHAIGDRAVQESLDAVVATALLSGGSDARHRLTHVELTHPDDVARFVKAGVSVDMQLSEHAMPGHMHDLIEAVGQDRVDERSWVLRDLWDSGTVVALSSDFDVNILNPFVGISWALGRGEQSLPDVASAVRAWTINGAYIMRSEERTGSLKVGKLADFIIVDRDIFSLTPVQIRKTKVSLTVLGGEVVYQRDGFVF